MAVLKASNMEEEGSVPGTCGREGRDETMLPRRRMWPVPLGVMGERKNLIRHARAGIDEAVTQRDINK